MASQYIANRYLGGSLFFPLQLRLYDNKISLLKPGIFHTRERTMPLTHIACVTRELGLFTGTVRVESSGGSEDIVAPGFNKRDIERFCNEVEEAIG
jgi:hypothetical protein